MVMDGLSALQERAQAAERRAAGFRKLVEIASDLPKEELAEAFTLLLEGGNGNGDERSRNRPTGSSPRGREAVRQIVAERPGVWSLAEIREALKRRGWFTSNKAVEVAVKRLCNAGECRRLNPGRYEFPAPAIEEAEAA